VLISALSGPKERKQVYLVDGLLDVVGMLLEDKDCYLVLLSVGK
jgi:hypothetical protein